ncbi:hypothetical protein P4S72_26385 [Vibrio sp. PP-XX7]
MLVKIATLYYEEGKKQSLIAQELDLSQSFVSRALTRCVKEGLVKISVVQPPNIYLNVESQIQKKYGINQAIVVDVEDSTDDGLVKKAIWLCGSTLSADLVACG